ASGPRAAPRSLPPPPAPAPFGRPAALALVLEDLASLSPGYWHRPSRAALLGHGDAAWLDGLGRWLGGMSLDDVADGQSGLPPGLGTLDFDALAEWRGAGGGGALAVGPGAGGGGGGPAAGAA